MRDAQRAKSLDDGARGLLGFGRVVARGAEDGAALKMYARDVLDAQGADARRVLADEPLEAVLHAEDVKARVDGLDGGGRDDRVDAGRGPAAHDDRQNLFVSHAEKPSPLNAAVESRILPERAG
jgi:hypothetical protein